MTTRLIGMDGSEVDRGVVTAWAWAWARGCFRGGLIAVGLVVAEGALIAQIAVRGDTVYTMAGEPIRDGVVVTDGGKIRAVGRAAAVTVPAGHKVLRAKVVVPGLIDAHSVIGLSGYLNQPHDQEQLERSAAIQPELRAIDAYNDRDPLVAWVRSFGVTTLHTGHAPGALVSGQTMVVKTAPEDVRRSVVRPAAMLAATLGSGVTGDKGRAPGTSAKAVAMMRAELLKAADYARKRAKAKAGEGPAQDLKMEALSGALAGRTPLLVTVNRHQDILAALRLAEEFKLKLVLDGVADAPLVLGEIRKSGFPVILHPTMARAQGEAENLAMDTATKLRDAGIPFALQSGYETYVPKTRVVGLEAALAAAHGLTFEQALAAVTRDAARILGVADRVGTLEPGKDGDIALFDGDPFEYTTRCVGVVVSGEPVELEPR